MDRCSSCRSLVADTARCRVGQQSLIGLGVEGVVCEVPGRYTVLKEHGRGGQARVLLAHDEVTGREVAIKEMLCENIACGSQSPDARALRTGDSASRFLREARITSQLTHPSIVSVYEIGRRSDGRLYYAMQFVRGRTMAQALAECSSIKDRMQLLDRFLDMCHAIAYAHSVGVVHRDIKPHNVMVGEFAETILLDWGLAKVVRGEGAGEDDEPTGDIRLHQPPTGTVDGTALGTPAYMSPEQARGQVDEIDERSDVFGLGAVLYEILTGQAPFSRESLGAVVEAVGYRRVRPVCQVCQEAPAELCAVAEKALSPDKADRYQMASLLADEMSAFMVGGRVRAYEYSSWDLLKRFAAHHKPLVITVAVVLTVIIGELDRTLRGHRAGINGLGLSPDGRVLASGSFDGTIRLWEMGTGVQKAVLRGHSAAVYRVKFSPDGRVLASGSFDGTIRLWEMGTGVQKAVLRGHSAAVYGISFDPSGRLLASASSDKTVRLWDAQAGTQKTVLEGHTGVVYSVCFSPDGRLLASGSFDSTIRLWDVETGKQHSVPMSRRVLHGHLADVRGAAFSPSGRLLASGSADLTLRLWDVKTGAQLKTLAGHTARMVSVSFSPDGRLLASGAMDSTVRLWDARTGVQQSVLRGHTAPVIEVAFSPDGRLLASGSSDQTVRLWDVRTGARLKVITGHDAAVWGVSFSPDGRLLASGSADRTISLWDAKTGANRGVLKGHTGRVFSVAFSPNGRELASGSSDGTVRLWSLSSGRGRIVSRGLGRVYSVAYHPDGRRLASTSSDGTARIQRLDSSKTIVLRGHRNEVNHIGFSADGHLVVTASDDRTVRVWETNTGRPYWRAPALLHHPPQMLTQRGWIGLLPGSAGDKPRRFASTRWRRAIERRARLVSRAPRAQLLCFRTEDDRLELWDLAADRQLLRRHVAGLQEVMATDVGCVAMANGKIILYSRKGLVQELPLTGVTAIAADGKAIMAASRRKMYVYPISGGRPVSSYRVDLGVTAVARSDGWLILGYSNGNIELVSPDAKSRKVWSYFGDVPANPVVRILPGPPGTLLVGYASGGLGIWALDTGIRLDYAHLHGPVVHLMYQGSRVYAATELGRHLVWDLSVFLADYCHVVREMWQKVPVVWEAGVPVLRRPRQDHRCNVRSGPRSQTQGLR